MSYLRFQKRDVEQLQINRKVIARMLLRFLYLFYFALAPNYLNQGGEHKAALAPVK